MRRRKRHEEHENHERWLVSYADFITLLFAFFVVMYSTSTHNQEKEQNFENSVKASLKIAMVGMGGGSGTSGSQNGGNAIFEKWVPELARGHSNEETDEFPEKGSSAEVQDFIKRQLGKKLSAERMEKDMGSFRHDSDGVRVTLAASSFFPSGSYKLKKSSLEILNDLAEVLKKTNRRVIIEGHTDNLPLGTSVGSAQGSASGSNVSADSFSDETSEMAGQSDVPIASNWELASLRATSVVRYLIQVQGLNPARLSAISYADQHPVASNATPEGRSKNRRIEILLVK